MRKIFLPILFLCSTLLMAENDIVYENLSLLEAKEIIKTKNLEINIAQFNVEVAALGKRVAEGYNYGKLDATLMGMRSNDAGNVFGFKLQSREATFGDFGFDEFLGGVSQALTMANGDFQAFTDIMQNPDTANQLLGTAPNELNYPDARNHFDLKFTYMIPLYTGGKLTRYNKIASQMVTMNKHDKEKVIAQKLYELEKVYYDISLLSQFEKDLTVIKKNIEQLQFATIEMQKEGYAKRTDLLEVETKLFDVERMIFQSQSNKKLSYQFLNFLLDSQVTSIKELQSNTECCKISLEQVLATNKDIQKAKLGLQIQGDMVEVKSSRHLPEIGAFAEYGSSDDRLLNDFTDHDRYTVGVQASINIFNGGLDSANIEQEKIKQLKVKQQVALAKKGIALQYKKIKTEIKNLNFQIESLKKGLELTIEIYNNYQERYKEGLASINDVVIKQSQQIEQLLKLLQLQNVRTKKILQVQKLAY
ncbi:MAG: TolC family protein [Campylobacterota bacterium]|nr:TolC family protein [Campylobacterota bacterium]